MTWTRSMFVYIAFVLLPATGILAAWQWRRENRSVLKGLVIGAGAVFLALIGSGILAHTLFPHYPREPSEAIALLFTIPPLITSLVVIWWLPKKQKSPTGRKFPFSALVSLVLIFVAGLLLTHKLTTWSYRAALPNSASEIQETISPRDPLLPDYSYTLKARITRAEFQQYIDHFHLKKLNPEKLGPEEGHFVGFSWVNQNKPQTHIFYRGNERWHLAAMYQDGYIYVESLLH